MWDKQEWLRRDKILGFNELGNKLTLSRNQICLFYVASKTLVELSGRCNVLCSKVREKVCDVIRNLYGSSRSLIHKDVAFMAVHYRKDHFLFTVIFVNNHSVQSSNESPMAGPTTPLVFPFLRRTLGRSVMNVPSTTGCGAHVPKKTLAAMFIFTTWRTAASMLRRQPRVSATELQLQVSVSTFERVYKRLSSTWSG